MVAEGKGKIMDIESKKILDNLRYMEERNGIFTLFYFNNYTGVTVTRSHEGYNHFAQWYIKLNGKIKKSYEIKERELALQAGCFLFYELVSNEILKIKEGLK
jgi:hypothetical protein